MLEEELGKGNNTERFELLEFVGAPVLVVDFEEHFGAKTVYANDAAFEFWGVKCPEKIEFSNSFNNEFPQHVEKLKLQTTTKPKQNREKIITNFFINDEIKQITLSATLFPSKPTITPPKNEIILLTVLDSQTITKDELRLLEFQKYCKVFSFSLVDKNQKILYQNEAAKEQNITLNDYFQDNPNILHTIYKKFRKSQTIGSIFYSLQISRKKLVRNTIERFLHPSSSLFIPTKSNNENDGDKHRRKLTKTTKLSPRLLHNSANFPSSGNDLFHDDFKSENNDDKLNNNNNKKILPYNTITIWSKLTFIKVMDITGDPAILIIDEDITDLKDKEILLQNALQRSTSASEFVANLSHEIRTPLNGILGMLEFLSDTQVTREQSTSIQTATQSAKNLSQLLSDVLDLTTAESGNIETNIAPISIGKLCRLLEHILQTVSATTNHRISFFIDYPLENCFKMKKQKKKYQINSLKYDKKFSSSNALLDSMINLTIPDDDDDYEDDLLFSERKKRRQSTNLMTNSPYLGQNLNPFIVSDILRIKQVLLNLINSSIKYTSSTSLEGSKNSYIKIRLKVFSDDECKLDPVKLKYPIQFEVEDNSEGFTEEQLNHLVQFISSNSSYSQPQSFNKNNNNDDDIDVNNNNKNNFHNQSYVYRSEFSDVGIGLTIAKRMTEILEGRLSIYSVRGKGTILTFSLPVQLNPINYNNKINNNINNNINGGNNNSNNNTTALRARRKSVPTVSLSESSKQSHNNLSFLAPPSRQLSLSFIERILNELSIIFVGNRVDHLIGNATLHFLKVNQSHCYFYQSILNVKKGIRINRNNSSSLKPIELSGKSGSIVVLDTISLFTPQSPYYSNYIKNNENNIENNLNNLNYQLKNNSNDILDEKMWISVVKEAIIDLYFSVQYLRSLSSTTTIELTIHPSPRPWHPINRARLYLIVPIIYKSFISKLLSSGIPWFTSSLNYPFVPSHFIDIICDPSFYLPNYLQKNNSLNNNINHNNNINNNNINGLNIANILNSNNASNTINKNLLNNNNKNNNQLDNITSSNTFKNTLTYLNNISNDINNNNNNNNNQKKKNRRSSDKSVKKKTKKSVSFNLLSNSYITKSTPVPPINLQLTSQSSNQITRNKKTEKSPSPPSSPPPFDRNLKLISNNNNNNNTNSVGKSLSSSQSIIHSLSVIKPKLKLPIESTNQIQRSPEVLLTRSPRRSIIPDPQILTTDSDSSDTNFSEISQVSSNDFTDLTDLTNSSDSDSDLDDRNNLLILSSILPKDKLKNSQFEDHLIPTSPPINSNLTIGQSSSQGATPMTPPYPVAPSIPSPRNIRILIAEDNKVNQLVIRKLLHQLLPNCVIDLAEDGVIAVDLFKKNISSSFTSLYQLVLMDIQMPNMDGFQASKLLRQFEAELHAKNSLLEKQENNNNNENNNNSSNEQPHWPQTNAIDAKVALDLHKYYKNNNNSNINNNNNFNVNNTRIPIVAITAATIDGIYEQSYQSGINEILNKPILRDHITQVLNKYSLL